MCKHVLPKEFLILKAFEKKTKNKLQVAGGLLNLLQIYTLASRKQNSVFRSTVMLSCRIKQYQKQRHAEKLRISIIPIWFHD